MGTDLLTSGSMRTEQRRVVDGHGWGCEQIMMWLGQDRRRGVRRRTKHGKDLGLPWSAVEWRNLGRRRIARNAQALVIFGAEPRRFAALGSADEPSRGGLAGRGALQDLTNAVNMQ